MNATTSTSGTATTGTTIGMSDWNGMSFREKFGDSLFKTDMPMVVPVVAVPAVLVAFISCPL